MYRHTRKHRVGARTHHRAHKPAKVLNRTRHKFRHGHKARARKVAGPRRARAVTARHAPTQHHKRVGPGRVARKPKQRAVSRRR